jgi:hypothetical protein
MALALLRVGKGAEGMTQLAQAKAGSHYPAYVVQPGHCVQASLAVSPRH